MSDRHTFRADWHHYNSGVFFVTICANHMEHIFGNIINNQMHFSAAGKIVKECVCDIPNHHKNVTVGNYVVMPNHVHIVLSVGAQYFESTENIRVFGGFLRAKGVFLEKNDGDRVVFPVFGKTLFCGNCLSWGLLRAC